MNCPSLLRVLLLVPLMMQISPSILASTPAPVMVGPIEVTPELRIEYSRDSNLYRSANNPFTDTKAVIEPTLAMAVEYDSLKSTLDLMAEMGRYRESSDDNYVDYSYDWGNQLIINTRNRITLNLVSSTGHQDRGTGLTESRPLITDAPIEYRDNSVAASYILGSTSSVGKLELSLRSLQKNYLNFEAITDPWDYQTDTASLRFSKLAWGETRFITEGTYTIIDYSSDPESIINVFDTLDSEASLLQTGFEWDVTGVTKGIVKAGIRKRNFDDTDRKDFSGGSWQADLVWGPDKRYTFTLSSGRESRETNGDGSFIDGRRYAVSWDMHWLRRLSSRLAYIRDERVYVQSATDRQDTLQNYNLSIEYQFRYWLAFTLNYLNSSNDSSSTMFDYDREVMSFAIMGNL